MVNITKKYRTVSSVMVLRIPRTLSPDDSDFFVKNTINENARVSDGHALLGG